jgi:hypothetical protein
MKRRAVCAKGVPREITTDMFRYRAEWLVPYWSGECNGTEFVFASNPGDSISSQDQLLRTWNKIGAEGSESIN